MQKGAILLLANHEDKDRGLVGLLQGEGYEVASARDRRELLALVGEASFDLALARLQPPAMPVPEMMEVFSEVDPPLPVVVIASPTSQASAIDALNSGAFHCLFEPVRKTDLRVVFRNAKELNKLRVEKLSLEKALSGSSGEMVGNSPEMTGIYKRIRKVAPTATTILLTGESGTGKELAARAIHGDSPRAGMPFISINCGALPESLLESELFGHVKGSFTGATSNKKGLFTLADGGSLLLDEIGEASQAIQVKLLRVLQEREIMPIGATKAIKVDVRVIAATNANLDRLVEEGTFRPDLFYRLNVVPIKLPPLRARKTDIPLLAQHFLHKFGGKNHKLTPEALDILVDYSWPGNIRELENIIERSTILSEGTVIDADSLNVSIFPEQLKKKARITSGDGLGVSGITLAELEKRYLLQTLRETGWVKKKAADILGIDPSTIYRKQIQHGIERDGEH